MKPIVYTEVELKNRKIFTDNFNIENENKYYYYNSTERIMNDYDLQNIIFEIYKILLKKYLPFGKIKNISFSFIGNDNIFICSFIVNKIKIRKKKKGTTMKTHIINWKDTDTQLKFVEEDEDNKNIK